MKPILLFLLTCAMWGQGDCKPPSCSPVSNAPFAMNFCEKSIAHARKWATDGTITRLASYDKNCKAGERGYHFVDDPEHKVAAPKPAVSSDKNPTCVEHGDCDNYRTGLMTKGFDDAPAPKPSFTVEKAVTVKSAPPDVECWYSSDGRPIPGKTMCNNLIPVTQYSCSKRPGYSTFLLPDESTGEKVCLNVLKEKP